MSVSESNQTRARGALGRAALLLLGFALALLLLELGLRAAAAAYGPRALAPAPAGRETVLALGDSHTYGVFFAAEQAYPEQLAGRLDARAPGRYRVLNLGLPGTNSSEVAARLDGWLDAWAPRHVVLCVGANNLWNRSGADGAEPSGALSGLRVLRLARLLRQRLAREGDTPHARPELERRVIGQGDVAVEFRDRDTGELVIRHEGNFLAKRPQAEALAILRRDLEDIHARLAERGVRLVLLTYAEHPVAGRMTAAQRNHARVNDVLRAFAAERDLALVDAAPRVRARLEAGAPVADYFHPDGSHPTPTGYAAIAEAVAEVFPAGSR